jgi:hypothetical protein
MKYKIIKLEKALSGNGSKCQAVGEHPDEHPIEWQGDVSRMGLYCCNDECNGRYDVLVSELTTPLKEPR